jgi:hypothetical protein
MTPDAQYSTSCRTPCFAVAATTMRAQNCSMEARPTEIGYREGEVFLPHRGWAVLFGVMAVYMMAALGVMLFELFHRSRSPAEKLLMVFNALVMTLVTCQMLYFMVRAIRNYVRMDGEGIEWRRGRRVFRMAWRDVRGVEFRSHRKKLRSIGIKGDRQSECWTILFNFYQKTTRQRIEAIVRERVPVELQRDRVIGFRSMLTPKWRRMGM